MNRPEVRGLERRRVKLAGAAGYVSATVLVLGGLAHALGGWPPMSSALRESGVDADLAGALAVGWFFGSVSMLTFGAIVSVSARRSSRGIGALPGVWLIAAAYAGFGCAAFLLRHFNPHFLIFIFSGLLVASHAALAGGSRPRP